jgi:plastocyanin
VKLHLVRSAALLAALSITFAACGPADDDGASPPAGEGPAESPAATPAESPATETPATDTGAVTVTGVEYAYENVPAQPSVGTTLAFENTGEEVHELVAVRKLPGVEDSWQDLLDMPQDEANSRIQILGALMAEPGQTADGTITLDEPGEYLFICFVPVGMTEMPAPDDPDAQVPEGPPHFTQGMLDEVTVAE